MSEAEVEEPDLTPTEPIDLRAELKKNLVEEFKAELSAQQSLSENQRIALVESVATGETTASSILQTLSEAED